MRCLSANLFRIFDEELFRNLLKTMLLQGHKLMLLEKVHFEKLLSSCPSCVPFNCVDYIVSNLNIIFSP